MYHFLKKNNTKKSFFDRKKRYALCGCFKTKRRDAKSLFQNTKHTNDTGNKRKRFIRKNNAILMCYSCGIICLTP